MVRIPSIAGILAVVFVLLAGAQARCDFIPWTYSTSTTTAFNDFGNDAVYPAATDPSSGNAAPSAGIAFSPVGPPVARSGPANILALGLHSWCYDANRSQANFFSPFAGISFFTLTFRLTDV